LVCAGYLFSGLMFGPDLDIHSQQYKRWGLLRWIWLPYRRSLRHRSVFSHGLIIGTIIRLLYLGIWLVLFAVVGIVLSAIAQQQFGTIQDWQALTQQTLTARGQQLVTAAKTYPLECLATAIGLELGALSHSLSDWTGSAWKRWHKQRRKNR
jgi:uncharacterized metal-binding protein